MVLCSARVTGPPAVTHPYHQRCSWLTSAQVKVMSARSGMTATRASRVARPAVRYSPVSGVRQSRSSRPLCADTTI